MSILKIGIIGYSKLNGHPYSLSALINGVNHNKINSCPFKSIKNYLRSYKKLNDFKNIKVTHIYTNNSSLDSKISNFANIDYRVKNYEDMRKNIDAVLICIHEIDKKIKIANYFLKNKIKVFIDKPAALDIESLKKYKSQIFSSSSLYYSKDRKKIELLTKDKDFNIVCSVGRGWKNYSVHLIEPLINIITKNKLSTYKKYNLKSKCAVFKNKNKKITMIVNKTKTPLYFEVTVDKKRVRYYFNDIRESFIGLLIDFFKFVKNKPNDKRLKNVINAIENGN